MRTAERTAPHMLRGVLEPGILKRPAEERNQFAKKLQQKMNSVIGIAAVMLLLLLLGDASAPGDSAAHIVLTWIILAISLFCVVEFVLRVIIAPSTWGYLKDNWWQIPLLLLPFLSVIRIFMAIRVARAGRLLVAAGRGARSADQKLRSRVLWLAALTAIVVMSATDVLLEYGRYGSYGAALHDAAMTAISGSGLHMDSVAAQILDPLLALYSVVVFAGLAATMGAFYLEQGPGAGERIGGARRRSSMSSER